MIRALSLNRSGASAAEFALVLPLLILLLLGMLDAARFMWEINRVEKATQMGARMAVVTKPVSTGLETHDYLGGGLTQGDIIPRSALGVITCGRNSCTCTGSCPSNSTVANADAFDLIFARMQLMKPDISADEVTVSYRGSGLGYAGDPHGMDISPLITVELSDVEFRPVTLLFAGGLEFDLPTFRTTLTAEDSSGSQSN